MQTIVSHCCILCHFMFKIMMMILWDCFRLLHVISHNHTQKDGAEDGAEWRGE